MATRKRDYKKEYENRIKRGMAKGLSKSQARGHPRHHEPYVAPIVKVRPWDPALEEGLKQIREGKSLAAASRSIDVAPERLRSYIQRTGVARKERSRWTIGPDPRHRQMLIYSRGHDLIVVLPDYQSANLAGHYMSAVGHFLDTNDPSVLAEFAGQGVIDKEGSFHPFEVEPNTLYRVSETGPDSFEAVYKILTA